MIQLMITGSPDPPPENVLRVVERWERREHSRLFGLITSGFPPTEIQISRKLVRAVRKECRGFQRVETLDILLDSSGGDADGSYQLATFLRSRCARLRVFVPDWAKSAATLFCLGADEIWMSATAELGPLDVQIRDPRNPQESPVSALEQFRAMDYLKRYSFEMLDMYVKILIRQAAPMRLLDVIREATPFVTQLTAPLYGQVDPFHLGGSYRSLDVAIEYGKRLMGRYAYADCSEREIEQLVGALAWSYPSHSFVIDFEEAKGLGLHVLSLEGETESNADEIIDSMSTWVGFVESEPQHTCEEETEREAANDDQEADAN